MMKIPEAREAFKPAFAGSGQAVPTRLTLAVTAARVQESKSRADAIRQLQATVAEFTRLGFTSSAFKARFALTEMEIRSGQRAIGRAHLASLEKDAAAMGFALITRKAQTALEATHSDSVASR